MLREGLKLLERKRERMVIAFTVCLTHTTIIDDD
jgi:hypothetical protein